MRTVDKFSTVPGPSASESLLALEVQILSPSAEAGVPRQSSTKSPSACTETPTTSSKFFKQTR